MDAAAWAWFAATVALGLAEMVTLTLAFAMVAVGTALAGLAAVLGAPAAVQAAVAVAASLAGLLGVRPVVRRHMSTPDTIPSGIKALLGADATVTRDVDESDGQVRVRGELWRARLGLPGTVLPVGSHVHIAAVEGATVLVHPKEQP